MGKSLKKVINMKNYEIKEDENHCPHCGQISQGGHCDECIRVWPGDEGLCSCRICKKSYTRSHPDEESDECPLCREWRMRGKLKNSSPELSPAKA